MSNINKIIKDNQYPAYVLASAGTGKTELIARKVEELIINEKVDIERIALITFTNKATSETLNRIKRKIYNAWENGNLGIRKQIDKLKSAKISTIHIFCDNIVREFAYEIGLCPNYTISNLTIEKDRIANEIVKKNFEKEIFEIIPMYKVVKLLKDIEERTSDKGIEVRLLKVKENNIWDKLRNYLCKIYPIYINKLEELKLQKGIITTNDLIKYAVKILNNKSIAPHILNSLEYLFLDEAQDINYEQAYLIEFLIKYGVKVFVVGDEKQSIYSFRGSDKNAFEYLVKFIKDNNGIEYNLETNYRTNSYIIDKVNNLFDKPFTYKNYQLEFKNHKLVARPDAEYVNNSISIIFNKSIEDIIHSLIKNENISPNDITILCRTNKDVMNVYYQLKETDIPIQSYISKSIYKSKILIDLVKVFNFVVGGGSLEKAELYYTDLYISAHLNNIGEEEFYNRLENLKITLKTQGILATIIQLLEDTYILEYYKKIDNTQNLANIQRFIEIIRNLENEAFTSMEIINYLNLMIITEQEENQPQVKKENFVTVSTIHTFKGLDSKVIIGYGIENNLNSEHFVDFYYDVKEGLFFNKDSIIPNSNLDKDIYFEYIKEKIIKTNLEEELRLLYVLMTRAKDKIILSANKSLNKMKYRAMQDSEYVSYLRWINNF